MKAAEKKSSKVVVSKTAVKAPIDPENQLLRTNSIVGPSSRDRDTEGSRLFASSHLVAAFVAGAVVALLLGWVVVWRPSSQRRRAGYDPIPNNSSSSDE